MARAKKDNVEQLRRALKERDEARAFQAATDEILTAISRSTSAAKPVFDAIVRNVPRLFDTRYVAVFLIKGEELHLAAARADATFQRRHGARFRRFQQSFPQPIHWGGFTGKALRSGKVSQIGPIIGNPKASLQAMKIAKEFGYNTMLVAPLMRAGKAIGAIGTTRPGVKLFSAKELALFKAFAAQAVIAIENARLFNETKEALERETATAEILKVISASPTSTQPVFESIVNNCGVLFKDSRVALWQISEGRLLPRASTGYMPEPMPLDRESGIGACVLESRTIHFADLRLGAVQHPRIKQLGLKHGYLSGVYAPLLREGQAIGAISVLRRKLGAFSDKEVALLGTFADQAVIAIENARLFNETKEALEQQTTTAGVLRVIAGSPTDLKPVMNAVVEKAARLLEADHALIGQADGEGIHWLAAYGCPVPDGTRSITRELPSGRAILDLQTTQIEDIGEIERDSLLERSYGRFGVRTICATPLIREGRAVGVILLRRTQVRPFTEKQMSLLRTFADQAVIAIENARLFNETKEALEQQIASSEILGVISTSPTDLRPVFDAILESATRLCDAHLGVLNLFEGEMCRTVAQRGGSPEFAKWVLERGAFKPAASMARVLAERRPFHVPDAREGPGFKARNENVMKFVELGGVRTYLAVPLLKEGAVVGSINIFRPEIRPFTEKQIALVSMFANQAVIAIENARLFNETKESLEQQTASADILRVISSTPSNTQPVFEAIVQAGLRVFAGAGVGVVMADAERVRVVAAAGVLGPMATKVDMPRSRDSATGTAVVDGVVVNIRDTEAPDAPVYARENGRALGFRAIAAAPMLREGKAIGAIGVVLREPGGLSDKQIALLKTFADQAVIAIENSRLFNETKESLEQQTAISEILRTISSSPSDLQPVFDTILDHAVRLGEGSNAVLWRYEDGKLRFAAEKNCTPEGIGKVKDTALELGAYNPTPQAGLERRTVHVLNVFEEPRYRPLVPLTPGSKGRAPTVLAVPLLKDEELLGVVSIWRREPRLFTDKQVAMVETFAAQAVIAIENVRLFNETKEALERQTATAEILGAISSSLTDTQPVFEIIAERAVALCSGEVSVVSRFDGTCMQLAAIHGITPEGVELLRKTYPLRLDAETATTRAFRSRSVVHVADVQADPRYEQKAAAIAAGWRSALAVPMLRGAEVIGVIFVGRSTAGLFDESQIELLKTFADQAVIAIENVRLFNETNEALERQTATAEILKVISASPSDVRPVFDAVAENAARVCGVDDVAILRTEGGELRRVAHYGSVPVSPDSLVPVPHGSVNERVLSQRRTLHIPDTLAASFTREFPGSQFPAMGVRALLATPLVHDGVAVGVIHLRRSEPRPFTDKQIALLETFADQAVIAIENVRLFNETREALERQTATGEILASISGSMTDTKPVFDAIVRNLLRLFGTGYAVVSLRRGQIFDLGGFRGEPGFERLQDAYPMPVDGDTIIGEVLIEQRVAKYAPIAGNPAVPRRTAELAQWFGFNSVMAAPMMWKGEAIGVILTARRQALPFDDKQVALIQSFADQAVIAIENVRLFKELQERTEALTKSVRQLTGLGEVGQAISSTLELDEVLRTIVQRAVQLAELDGGSIWEFDERDERFHLRAAENIGGEILDLYRKSSIQLGEGALGRSGATREPVVVEDVLDESYQSRVRELLIRSGARALLAVPLLREDRLLGALVVNRKSPGPFAPEVIELLKTFATQSAVAIQNARLFREIAEKSHQLEEASRHKSQFLASMSHELRTPLNAILGFNEMILGQVYGEVPSDMKEPLEDIQKSGRHLLRLINNVLDLAKIEAGKMELSLADYSVHDTVESVRSTLRPLAEAKGLELVVSVPQDIPLAYGDGGRLTQCLMN
ncbi:MAG TPA: GAF domain-containing protein, partial [Burkholderiales bacterium]|nr:GAF domain-containing protein [Burkholderiales bacterium]